MVANKLISVKANPKVQSFLPGDTVRVGMRIKEGERERVQAFQGVVINYRGRPPATSFTVRRVTYGVGVERTFPLYSPLLVGVDVLRRGDVRRGNLAYLRSRFGRAARIRERAWTGAVATEGAVEEPAQEGQPAEAAQEQPAPAAAVEHPAPQPAVAPAAAVPAATTAEAAPAAESKPAVAVTAEAPAPKPEDKPAAQ